MDVKGIIRSLIEEKLSESVAINEQFNTEKGEAKEINGKKYIGLNLLWNGEKFGEVHPYRAISQTKSRGSRIATSQKTVVRWSFSVPSVKTDRYAMTNGFSSRDEAAQAALKLYRKNIEESLDEASNSKLDKAMAIINARITKPGQQPKYPSFDSAPEDIKAAARNLAKNLKESETLDEDAKALFQKIKKHAANLGDKFVQGALHGATFGMMGHDTHDPLTGDAYDKVKPFSNRIKKKKMKESLDEVAIIKNGRKYSNVKWFETEKGANDFLEKNPDFGVIQADKGGVYVANNKNKGTPVK